LARREKGNRLAALIQIERLGIPSPGSWAIRHLSRQATTVTTDGSRKRRRAVSLFM